MKWRSCDYFEARLVCWGREKMLFCSKISLTCIHPDGLHPILFVVLCTLTRWTNGKRVLSWNSKGGGTFGAASNKIQERGVFSSRAVNQSLQDDVAVGWKQLGCVQVTDKWTHNMQLFNPYKKILEPLDRKLWERKIENYAFFFKSCQNLGEKTVNKCFNYNYIKSWYDMAYYINLKEDRQL